MSGWEVRQGDCLEEMARLPDGCADLILCDLPYGSTGLEWDQPLPLESLWVHYRRIIKRNGAVVLTAVQPFASELVASNLQRFKYELIWRKAQPSAPGVAKYRPLPCHENVLVFAAGPTTYNPQMGTGEPYRVLTHNSGGKHGFGFLGKPHLNVNLGSRYPVSVIDCAKDRYVPHPTQKPVALMEYLILTYTDAGETVLDNCMGSGSTGVAALNVGRRFIGIERDPAYFAIAEARLRAAEHPEIVADEQREARGQLALLDAG